VGDAIQLQDVPAHAGFPGCIDLPCRPQFPVVLPPDRFIPPEASQVFMPITAMLAQDPTFAKKFVEGCFAARPCQEAWRCLTQFLAHVRVSIPFVTMFLSDVFNPKISVFSQSLDHQITFSVPFFLEISTPRIDQKSPKS
jgi:hypothetical protein